MHRACGRARVGRRSLPKATVRPTVTSSIPERESPRCAGRWRILAGELHRRPYGSLEWRQPFLIDLSLGLVTLGFLTFAFAAVTAGPAVVRIFVEIHALSVAVDLVLLTAKASKTLIILLAVVPARTAMVSVARKVDARRAAHL